MRNVILFDDDTWEQLLPLTFTRPLADIRCGILTIKEKWERHLDANVSFITQEYLSDRFPIEISDDNLVIAGNTLPNARLVRLINELGMNEALMFEDELIAARLSRAQFDHLIHNEQIDELDGYHINETPVERIQWPWQIFEYTGTEIDRDYKLLTKGKNSQALDSTSVWEGKDIFVEEGASVKHCIIDASEGPVYIGKSAVMLAGSIIKGPFALGNNGVVKMGAKIYGPTSIGPGSKVGGEIKNCVFFANSNKSHDGYLGNSVIGEWCNLGADTNTSNLKNDYGEVSLWNYSSESYTPTGLQFCGMIMGDHSKAGINSMFNTGTVVGVSCNVFGGGFQPRHIPSFSWGGGNELQPYRVEKAIEVGRRVMSRKNLEFDTDMENIFNYLAKNVQSKP